MFKKVIVLYFSIILLSCKTSSFNPEMESIREGIRNERAYIYDEWKPAGKHLSAFYGSLIVNSPESSVYPIWHYSLGMEMDSMVGIPSKSVNKTILFIHGYAGTLAGFGKIMAHYLNKGYTVIGLTLPGHGLSQGERGGIGDFDTYGKAVHEFLLQIEPFVPPIEYAIGHSTGCTSLIIHNENYGWDIKGAVFLAPLIRSAFWYPSTFARFISRPFIHSVGVKWKEPFAIDYFPFSWFDRLSNWNKRLENYSVKENPIYIFQGSKDDVVSWKYNVNKIKEYYPNSQSLIIDKGGHVSVLIDDSTLEIILPVIDNFFLRNINDL